MSEQAAEQNQIEWEDEAHATEEAPADDDPKAADASPGPSDGQRVAKVGPEEAPRPSPALPEPAAGAAPPWAIIPRGLRAPRGRQVYFARFPSSWTDTPREGVPGSLTDAEAASWRLAGYQPPELWRQCIFWALSIGDQKIALAKANGDPNRFNSCLAQQMIRAIDGEIVDRSGADFGSGSMELWWERLGERCRSELARMCTRIHTLTVAERALFFGHCVAARTAG